MIEEINRLIGETDAELLAQIYTNIFYTCFTNTFITGFSQTTNALRLRKTTEKGYVDLLIIAESNSESLPDRPGDSIRFYELLDVVGGNRKMAKISPIIQFKTLPETVSNVDQWLKIISSVSIDLNVAANTDPDSQEEETFFAENLKIIESYEVEKLSVARTVNGEVVDVCSKEPAAFSVTLSDWIVEALAKNYLRLNIVEKLHCRRELLPVI